MVKVNIQDAKTHLSQYLDEVEQGEVVVVCRHNKPVAELRAVVKEAARSGRVPGLLKGQVRWSADGFAPMSEEDLAEFDGGSVFPIASRQ